MDHVACDYQGDAEAGILHGLALKAVYGLGVDFVQQRTHHAGADLPGAVIVIAGTGVLHELSDFLVKGHPAQKRVDTLLHREPYGG